MRAVLETIGRVATADVAVLLRGESDAGKTVLARAPHSQSARFLQDSSSSAWARRGSLLPAVCEGSRPAVRRTLAGLARSMLYCARHDRCEPDNRG